jgi:peptidoglycan/LPS O-acetylase OafA/YrhL
MQTTTQVTAPTGKRAIPDNSRSFSIDLLRGIAIFLVFLYHSLASSHGFAQFEWGPGLLRNFDVPYTFLLLSPATLGWAGVAIFFAVSGFCIHHSYSKERKRGAGRYLIKRTFRIYPPFLIAVLILSFCYPWLEIHKPNGVRCLVYHLLMIHNFSETCVLTINPAFWSISIEFQLYLIYLILIKMVDIFGWNAVIFATFSTEMGLRIWLSCLQVENMETPQLIFGSPFLYVFSWTIGARICEMCLRHEERKVPLCIPLALIGGAILSAFIKPLAQFGFPLFSVATAIFILRDNGNQINRYKIFKWGVLLGVASYSYYLYHIPVLVLVRRLVNEYGFWFTGHPFISFWICVVVAVPVYSLSLFLRNFVEVPSVSAGYHILKLTEGWGPQSRAAVARQVTRL